MHRRDGSGVLLALALLIAIAAAPARLKGYLRPERILETAMRIELGAAPIVRSETVTPSPAPTPAPTAAPDTQAAPSAPGTTPDGTPILSASFPGGLTTKNETDFSPDLAALLQAGPGIALPREGVQVLIVHTHSSEAYTPAGLDQYDESDAMRTEDTSQNIIRVGDALADALTAAGLNVLHDRTIHDYPSYTGSYSRSAATISAALEAHPEIAVVIDLHRDALCSDDVVYKTVAELPDGEAAAQVMFVVGTNGTGLEHPDWERNLRLAVYLQNAVDAQHPTLMRPIWLVNERYNQHLSHGSLLIEIGSSGNTLQEALRAAELFGSTAGRALAELIS